MKDEEPPPPALDILAFRKSVSDFKYTPSSSPSAPGPRRSPRKPASTTLVKHESDNDGDALPNPNIAGTSRKRYTSEPEQGKKTRDPSRSSKKQKRGYAPPETYAHLNMLSDCLAEGLDVLFCGINPGYMSAETGHHFANPVNHFWRCLHRSGLTPTLLPPTEDSTLPSKYNLGITNLVDRPSAEAAELSAEDRISGVPVLLGKIARFRPRILCFVGKGIWLDVERVLKKNFLISKGTAPVPAASTTAASSNKNHASPRKRATAEGLKFSYEAPQPYKVVHDNQPGSSPSAVSETLFFVVPSTSGRVVSHQLNDKIKLFTALQNLLGDLKNGTVNTSHMAVVRLPAPAS